MASYMLLLVFAVILLSIDARLFHKTWSKIKDYNTISDINDIYSETDRFLDKQENSKRQLPKFGRLSDLFYFRDDLTNTNEYEQQSNKLNYYDQYEQPTENDYDYNRFKKTKYFFN
ncbi:unnamed protein product [Rotaria sp. Silwood2]|nr:unnamed protein product [Rotaria sp. Silwood2]CAF3980400.1 unnamed protein product [Rotaria sp. Silwood2]